MTAFDQTTFFRLLTQTRPVKLRECCIVRPADKACRSAPDFFFPLFSSSSVSESAPGSGPAAAVRQIGSQARSQRRSALTKSARKQAQLSELTTVILDGAQVASTHYLSPARKKENGQSIKDICPKVTTWT